MHRRSFVISVAALPLCARPLAAQAEAILPRELFNRDGSFSDLALSMDGERIRLKGYMAPPLKANMAFFVLTQRPMAVCPFCEPDTEWPDDILPIYTKRVVDPVYYTVGIEAEGILELGEFIEEETGFWSPIRLADATYG